MSRSMWLPRFVMVLALVFVPAIVFPPGLAAQEELYDEPTEIETEKRHEIALFLGNTHSDGDNGFTLGLDYEYKFNRRIGMGGLVDYAGKDFRSFIAGIPIYFHATRSLTFQLAPAYEHADGENNPLVRLGALYGFDVGPMRLVPAFFFDFVDSETVYVFGVNFAWEF